MKKTILSILLFFALASVAGAQKVAFHLGAQAGVNVNSLTVFGKGFKGSDLAGFHAGLTSELKLPAYFSIQPSVNFEWSRGTLQMPDANWLAKLRTNVINVPVAIQWGPDLGIVRLYAQVVPYLDFIMGTKANGEWKQEEYGPAGELFKPVQFGIGLGAGLEIWRMQLSCRYNFGLTKASGVTQNNLSDMINRRGWTITLAYMFL